MEIGFRSFNLALLDNAVVEYQVLTDFFSLKGDEVSKVFNNIFERTFQCGHVSKTGSFSIGKTNHELRNTLNSYLRTPLMHMAF